MAAVPSLPATQTVVRLRRRPVGNIVPGEDLVAEREATPTPGDVQPGQVLVHRLYLSLDPAMRGWLRDMPSYVPPVGLGEEMRGSTLDEVVYSRDERFRVGDVVKTQTFFGGWSEFRIVKASWLQKIDVERFGSLPLSAHLSVLGITGLTAYFGLLKIGVPQPGETVMVSAAAGATGSVVCQIAKIVGCKVIGIAGGEEKCRWLREELGCDATLDYKAAGQNSKALQGLLRGALKVVGAKGVDVFFDNVGGFVLNETFRRLNYKARIVVCGGIAGYNVEDIRADVPAPTNYMALLTTRSRMEGFVYFDYVSEFPKATVDMLGWIKEGRLKFKDDVREGLDKAPDYLLSLFNGSNTGKLMVKVGDRLTQPPLSSRL